MVRFNYFSVIMMISLLVIISCSNLISNLFCFNDFSNLYKNDKNEYNDNSTETSLLTQNQSIPVDLEPFTSRGVSRAKTIDFGSNLIKLERDENTIGKIFRLEKNITIIEAKLVIEGIPGSDVTLWDDISCVSDHKYTANKMAPKIDHNSTGNTHIIWMDQANLDGPEGDWDIIYKEQVDNKWQFDVISIDKANSPSQYPDFIIDKDDKAHIVWEDQVNISEFNNGLDKDIFYRWRKTGGESWGSTKVISDEVGPGDSINPCIDITLDGDLIFVWQDNENNLSKGPDDDIFCRFFYENNNTWSKTVVLSDNINDGSSTEPDLAVDGNYIYVVWVESGDINYSGNDNDIILRIWDGFSWSKEIVISNLSFDDNSTAPTIDASDGVVAIAWLETGDLDQNSSNKDILFKKFKNSELIETEIITKSPEELDSNEPDLKIDTDGNIHIVWSNEEKFTPTNIYYRNWNSLTEEWSGIVLISDYSQFGIPKERSGSSTWPQVEVKDDSRVEIVWTDDTDIENFGFDPDIFYRISDLIYPKNLELRITLLNDSDNSNGVIDWFFPDDFIGQKSLPQSLLVNKLNNLISSMNGPFEDFNLNFKSDTNGSLRIINFTLKVTSTPRAPSNIMIYGETIDHVTSHTPTITWDFSDLDSLLQGGFEVQVGVEPGMYNFWKYGPVDKTETFIKYTGEQPLLDGQTYYVRIKVKDELGAWSTWSESVNFTMNSVPEIITLLPNTGEADEYLDIEWSAKDLENDNLTYTLDYLYEDRWYPLLNDTKLTKFRFDTSNLKETSIDLQIKAFDGFEESNWFNKLGFINIRHNDIPRVVVLTPTKLNEIANDTYRIYWKTIDSDDLNHTVTAYYDIDTDFGNKILIVQNITDTGNYQWQCSMISEGIYYICINVSDNKGWSFGYSEGTVKIDHSIDTNPPKILEIEPGMRSHNITLTQQIRVKFNKEMDPATVEKNFFIRDIPGNRIDGWFEWYSSFQEFAYHPKLRLEYGQVYHVTLKAGTLDKPGIIDKTGNLLDGNGDNVQQGSPEDDFNWTFSTVALSVIKPPNILSINPKDNDINVIITPTITTIFSDIMKIDSISQSTIFVIDQDGKFIDIEVNFIVERSELRISFIETLEYEKKYTVLITADVHSDAGLGLDGNRNGISEGSPMDDFQWSFTTIPSEKVSNGDSEDVGVSIIGVIILISIIILVVLVIIFSFFKKRSKHDNLIIHDIFVIYNDGRLIAHQSFEKKSHVDESAMSGMLTAIQNFISESFFDQDEEKLEEIKYGKLKILLIHGKFIYLAVITSGDILSKKFQTDMGKILTLIELKYNDELRKWDGSMKKVRDIGDLIKF